MIHTTSQMKGFHVHSVKSYNAVEHLGRTKVHTTVFQGFDSELNEGLALEVYSFKCWLICLPKSSVHNNKQFETVIAIMIRIL